VGVSPLLPTYCVSFNPNNQPYYVEILVGGTPFAVLPDTGSSNLAIAADACTSCDVSPKVPTALLPARSAAHAFEIAYGTGATVSVVATANLTLAPGVVLPRGRFGAIVRQNTSFGFNLFPPRPPGGRVPPLPTRSQDTCYNTYAGVMGLAFAGQGARPAPGAPPGVFAHPATTNGTTTQVVDQAVAQIPGFRNAFALELCVRYPYACQPQRRPDNTSWEPTTACGQTRVGHLMWGGYASKRLAGPMQFAQLTDEIHLDVQLLGMEACGPGGAPCAEVLFPDPVDGATEDACNCTTADCAPGTVNYCSFAVVESGAGRLYMNTPNNARALLSTLRDVGVVSLPADVANNATAVHDFYFGKAAVPGARVAAGASLTVALRGWSPTMPNDAGRGTVSVPVALDGAVFRHVALGGASDAGLVQWGIQGDLEVLAGFAAAKFPTLLGDPFLQGKTVFVDRGARRIGFAANAGEGICTTAAVTGDIDVFGSNSNPTPGYGCRRGTGSGGGCPQ
jgi:hypothetical protein